jgi:hypothetical protein
MSEASMSDEPGNRDAPSRERINLTEYHEVKYWTATLGVDEATLTQAVVSAGTSVAAVRDHLRRRKGQIGPPSPTGT